MVLTKQHLTKLGLTALSALNFDRLWEWWVR